MKKSKNICLQRYVISLLVLVLMFCVSPVLADLINITSINGEPVYVYDTSTKTLTRGESVWRLNDNQARQEGPLREFQQSIIPSGKNFPIAQLSGMEDISCEDDCFSFLRNFFETKTSSFTIRYGDLPNECTDFTVNLSANPVFASDDVNSSIEPRERACVLELRNGIVAYCPSGTNFRRADNSQGYETAHPDYGRFTQILCCQAPVPLIIWLFAGVEYKGLFKEYSEDSSIRNQWRQEKNAFDETPEGRARILEERARDQLRNEALERGRMERPGLASHLIPTSVSREDIIGRARKLAREEGVEYGPSEQIKRGLC